MDISDAKTLPAKSKKSAVELRWINAWQKKLLPWLILMPTLLIFLFVYLATKQMQRFNVAMDIKSESIFDKALYPRSDSAIYNKLISDKEYIRWMTLTRMEEKAYDRRYDQSLLLLQSRIFTKYLGFFTGMILAIVGAIFIISKLQEEQSDLQGGIEAKVKLNLSSSSPGVIFGVLGTALMLSTIMQHSEIKTDDKAMFLTQANVLLFQLKAEIPADTATPDKISAKDLNDLFGNIESK